MRDGVVIARITGGDCIFRQAILLLRSQDRADLGRYQCQEKTDLMRAGELDGV